MVLYFLGVGGGGGGGGGGQWGGVVFFYSLGGGVVFFTPLGGVCVHEHIACHTHFWDNSSIMNLET